MRLNSKRLRVSHPESNTDADEDSNADGDDTVDSPDAVPSTPRSSTSDDINTYRNVFTVDILPVILDNLQILTPTDLLHFRLVNRCWRDAATSILLKRNACDIVLKIGQVTYNCVVNIESHEQLMELHEDHHAQVPPAFKCCNARPPYSLLPDLIRLISASPKFPSNSIKFLPGCEKALSKLTSTPANEDYQLEEDELLRLFSLYGKKIRKLTFSSEIHVLTVQNLLFVHLPNLTCLDLRNYTRFASLPHEPIDASSGFEFPLLKHSKSNSQLSNQTLKLEKICSWDENCNHPLANGEVFFLKKIVNISPHLWAIQDVGVVALLLLITNKDARLVKSVQYNPPNSSRFMNLLARFCSFQGSFALLKLNRLTVKFSKINENSDLCRKVTAILNMILRGSKDTLEYLELHVSQKTFLGNIKIPPMGKLKCLKLVKENASLEQIIPVDQRDDLHVFQFENEQDPGKIPPDYFPQLSKVVLDVDPGSVNTNDMLLAFFALEHPGIEDESIVGGDIMPSVTSLEMTAFPDVDNKLGKLFPYLRNLKIKCAQQSMLYNWVWEAFPKLEIFEVDNFVPSEQMKSVDVFFTGISQKLCTKFDRNDEAAGELEFSPELIRFLRTQPYIGDCANLKEFTMNFGGKLSNISKMTCLHAFEGIIQQTKIFFSFESANLSEQEIKEIRKHMKHVAPYIGIRP